MSPRLRENHFAGGLQPINTILINDLPAICTIVMDANEGPVIAHSCSRRAVGKTGGAHVEQALVTRSTRFTRSTAVTHCSHTAVTHRSHAPQSRTAVTHRSRQSSVLPTLFRAW